VKCGAAVLAAALALVAHAAASAGEPPRLISLAPFITELVYAAGAGERLVGVDSYSDYPSQAQSLPDLGDAFHVDLEALVAQAPDYVLAWASGTPPQARERLRHLGVEVVVFEPSELEGIAVALRRIGELAQTTAAADRAAERFEAKLKTLRRRHRGAASIRYFYQVSAEPLYTLNGNHLASQGLSICGGVNVFAELPTLAPQVGVEAVVTAAPEAIIAGVSEEQARTPLARWHNWPTIPAVAAGNLFRIEPDTLVRQTPRILDGIEMVCSLLDRARQRLASGTD